MIVSLKKLIFTIFLNSSLLIALIFLIQNSSSKTKVNLIFKDSVELPLSFILGTSFISGSFISGLVNVIYKK